MKSFPSLEASVFIPAGALARETGGSWGENGYEFRALPGYFMTREGLGKWFRFEFSDSAIFTHCIMSFHIPDYVNFKQFCVESYGSIENLITKAKNGNGLAQGDLGMAYSEDCDDLLPKDTDKAIGWLNTAVENGCEHPVFLGKLGELLDRKGTPQHRRKAYEMYHRAAKLGSSSSQLNLAEMYRCGVDGVVNEDLCEAFKWYKKAAGEDHADELDLGVLDSLRFGTIKKLANAAGGFKEQKAALQFLYKYYLEGDCPEGRPQPTKAVFYLTRAAELGDTKAQRNLGEIHLTGSCDQIKDVAKARRWFEKASASGDVSAKKVCMYV